MVAFIHLLLIHFIIKSNEFANQTCSRFFCPERSRKHVRNGMVYRYVYLLTNFDFWLVLSNKKHMNNLKNTILQEYIQIQSKNANKYHDKLSIIWLLMATADDVVKVNYYKKPIKRECYAVVSLLRATIQMRVIDFCWKCFVMKMIT